MLPRDFSSQVVVDIINKRQEILNGKINLMVKMVSLVWEKLNFRLHCQNDLEIWIDHWGFVKKVVARL